MTEPGLLLLGSHPQRPYSYRRYAILGLRHGSGSNVRDLEVLWESMNCDTASIVIGPPRADGTRGIWVMEEAENQYQLRVLELREASRFSDFSTRPIGIYPVAVDLFPGMSALPALGPDTIGISVPESRGRPAQLLIFRVGASVSVQ